jgi:hypothetical protein
MLLSRSKKTGSPDVTGIDRIGMPLFKNGESTNWLASGFVSGTLQNLASSGGPARLPRVHQNSSVPHHLLSAIREMPDLVFRCVPLETVALSTASIAQVRPSAPNVGSEPVNDSPAPYSEERFAAANGTYERPRHSSERRNPLNHTPALRSKPTSPGASLENVVIGGSVSNSH